MYLLEASLSIPGSRVVPERVRALAWEPIQLRTSLVRGGDQTYSTYSTTDADILLGGGQTDRSIDRGGRRTCSRDEPTNLDTLHSVLAAPPRSPSSSRLAPVGHTTHAIHRRRRANDSVDDRGRCVLVSVDAVAPGPRGPPGGRTESSSESSSEAQPSPEPSPPPSCARDARREPRTGRQLAGRHFFQGRKDFNGGGRVCI